MIVAFETADLRELCRSTATASAELGDSIATCLRTRLAELRAADSVAELPLAPLSGNIADGIISVELGGDRVLRYAVNHRIHPRLPNGSTDWTRVTRVKIIYVGGENAQ